jgi:hypothetical protein
MKIRFPNYSEFIEFEHFDEKKFVKHKEFQNEVFGYYGNAYISVLKESE